MGEPKCVLRSVDNTHDPINLPDGKEVILGRGPETKIKESRCSRNQVKFVANFSGKSVEVTQIGRNCCGVNGLATKKDTPVTVHHGDTVQVLLGQFGYSVEFTPLPKERNAGKEQAPSSTTKAISLSDSEDEEPLAKRAKNLEDSGDKRQFWESCDNGKLLIYSPMGVHSSTMIGAYDLDNTIITTQSGAVFPKNIDDWKIISNDIILKFKELDKLKYRLIIFTNQAGISNGKQNLFEFQKKIENIVKKLTVPVQVFVATGQSYYRKPCPGMWEVAMTRNGKSTVNHDRSFYCGDAAGRDEAPGRKKDFSQCDLLFARNINVHFVTPEHHFYKKKVESLKIKVFDPSTIKLDTPLCSPEWGVVILNKLELIVLVGAPGSGKTHFFKTHMEPAGYVHINRDTLGSVPKCVAAADQALSKKQSVVVDNTNPDLESRRRFIDLAKGHLATVRCFIMNTTLPHVRHNNKFRQLTDPSHSTITDIIINSYNVKYVEPTTAEGFSEILKINFWPTHKDPQQAKVYKMFLLEK